MSAELACVYAALILNDEGLEITGDKMSKLISAAGVKVEGYWVDLFAEYFKNHDIAQLIKGTSLGGAAPAQSGPAPVAGQTKVEEKKKEEEAAAAAPLDLGDMFGDW